MITCLSGWPAARQYARLSFAAVSIASEPPPGVKKIFAPSMGTSAAAPQPGSVTAQAVPLAAPAAITTAFAVGWQMASLFAKTPKSERAAAAAPAEEVPPLQSVSSWPVEEQRRLLERRLHVLGDELIDQLGPRVVVWHRHSPLTHGGGERVPIAQGTNVDPGPVENRA